MKRAWIMLRSTPHYRREAFRDGLERLGFTVVFDDTLNRGGTVHAARPQSDDDILVIWNRYGAADKAASVFEKRGCKVIVAENGYIPMHNTDKAFALALNLHNGCGRYPTPTYSRVEHLAVELQPWRVDDRGDILLLPQRGIGNPGVAMPRTWASDVLSRIGRKWRVRVRNHPGTRTDGPTLEDDLKGARCAVIWGSGAGLKAICLGIPVFHELENWIGRDAAKFGLADLVDLPKPDRGAMLERVAWAQWTCEEVTTGEPFARLIEVAC